MRGSDAFSRLLQLLVVTGLIAFVFYAQSTT